MLKKTLLFIIGVFLFVFFAPYACAQQIFYIQEVQVSGESKYDEYIKLSDQLQGDIVLKKETDSGREYTLFTGNITGGEVVYISHEDAHIDYEAVHFTTSSSLAAGNKVNLYIDGGLVESFDTGENICVRRDELGESIPCDIAKGDNTVEEDSQHSQVLQLSEVALKEDADWVEVRVLEGFYGGTVILKTGSTVIFEGVIPALPADTLLVFITGPENCVARQNCYEMSTNLQGTDNVISVILQEQVQDVLVVSNNNGKFTKSPSVVRAYINAGHWSDFPVESGDEGAWISTEWLVEGASIVRRAGIDTNQASDWTMTHSQTLGDPNIVSAPPSKSKSSSRQKVYDPIPMGDLRIFRILPYPKSKESENEQIILKNMSSKPINFAQLTISDTSFKKTPLPAYTLLPQDEITLFARFFGITLDNNGDSLFLYNTDGEVLDFITYPELSQGEWYVYNHQQALWRTHHSFIASEPVWATDFSIKGYMFEGDDLIFSCTDCSGSIYWEFGDGQVGYGKEVGHRYEAAGTYIVQMMQDGSNILSKNIVINKRPQSTLQFVEVLPDPLGPDKDHEYIILENTGQESIDMSLYGVYSEVGEELCFFHKVNVLAGNTYKINPAEIGCSLRNSKDTLVLYDHFKRVHDSITYTKTRPGEVIFTQKTGSTVGGIQPDKGSDGLMILGRVMVPPGIIGKKTFVVCEQATSCMKVEATYDLNIVDGSILQVEVVEDGQQYKHYKKHYAQILTENFLPEFQAVEFDKNLFALVQVNGKVISESKGGFVLGTEFAEHSVIWNSVEDGSSMLGRNVSVIGVYNPDKEVLYARAISHQEVELAAQKVDAQPLWVSTVQYLGYLPFVVVFIFLGGVAYLKYG